MIKIRIATLDDVPLIRRLIWELADYEREGDEVRITEEMLAKDGFGETPQFHALVAEWDAEAAGFALYFNYYSTWRGKGLHLEDLYVRPALRGRGIGTALIAEIARIAAHEGRLLVKWEVLGWNQGAVELYKSLGAIVLEDWRSVLLEGEALKKLAEKAAA
jgi:GNAT superfamily N-acetyltransferase